VQLQSDEVGSGLHKRLTRMISRYEHTVTINAQIARDINTDHRSAAAVTPHEWSFGSDSITPKQQGRGRAWEPLKHLMFAVLVDARSVARSHDTANHGSQTRAPRSARMDRIARGQRLVQLHEHLRLAWTQRRARAHIDLAISFAASIQTRRERRAVATVGKLARARAMIAHSHGQASVTVNSKSFAHSDFAMQVELLISGA
jgi:hypothetical protein